MDIIPWPIAYGVGGGSLVVLLTFGIWFLRQLAKGYDSTGKGNHGLVPGSAVEGLVQAEKRRADDLIELHTTRSREMSATLETERSGRVEAMDLLRDSVQSNKIVDAFFTEFLPKPPPGGEIAQ